MQHMNEDKKQSLFARIFDVTVMNYLTLCLNLLTGVMTARLLGPSQKGVYYAVSSWVDMIGYLGGLGMNQAFVWYYHGNANRRKLFHRTVQMGLVLITISSIVGGILIWFPLHRLGGQAVFWAAVGVVMLPVGTLYGISTTYLMARGNVAVYNRLRIIQSVSCTIGIAILALVHYLDVDTYFSCLYASSFLVSISCVMVTFRSLRSEPDEVGSRIPKLSEYMSKSLAYFVPSLSSLFNERLDQMICTIWLSKTEIGLYGISISAVGVLGTLIGGFSTVFYPSMAQSDHEVITTKGNKAFRIYLVASLIAMVAVIALSPAVLRIMYGRQYETAYPIIIGLAPVAIFAGLIGILYQGFFSAGKPSYALTSEIAGAVSGALLIWLLAPRMGGVGVAIANSLSYALDFTICLFFWFRMGGKTKELIPKWVDISGLWLASVGRIKGLAHRRVPREEGI